MPALGGHLSEVARAKVSAAQKGRVHKPHEGYQKGHAVCVGTEKTRFKKGAVPWNKGLSNVYTAETKIKMGQWQIGKKQSEETIQKRTRSRSWYKHHSQETRDKISKANNRGLCILHGQIKKTREYNEWRKSVYARDGWKCLWCGSKKRIEADHIKPFSLYPELRFDINNGRTLCHECHLKTDTYGYRLKNYEKNNIQK